LLAGDRRLGAVALEDVRRRPIPTALLAAHRALDDQVAIAGGRAGDQQIDARPDDGGIRRRHLLADDPGR
jgi:hypothetical protein